MTRKRTLIFSMLVVAVIVATLFATRTVSAPDAVTLPGRASIRQSTSLSDPTSISVVVNKLRPLVPNTYEPNDLVVPSFPHRANITDTESHVSQKIVSDLEAMVAAASAAGKQLNLQSGYRSYNFQISLYNGYVESQGQSVADSQSARPGYSEHQTGLAADLGSVSSPECNVMQCFADTPEGKWLAVNAYKYGFIIRYPAGKQSVTGYEYEPWHIRYVGKQIALNMHNRNTETLEEYYKLSPAPDYN